MSNFPHLAASGVNIFALRSDASSQFSRLPEFTESLSDIERTRAARFRTARLAERFVLARAMLRKVLGVYLQETPADLDIRSDSRGRPFLPDYPDMDFNLSHTDGLSVLAVSRDIVGVDVERLRDDFDAEAISRKVFSARESARIPRGVPPSKTPFFDYWTIKEAYAKSVGMGMRLNFGAIDVSLDDALSVDLEGVSDDARRWTFHLYGCHNYRVAVAIRRPSCEELAVHLVDVDGDLEPRGTFTMQRTHTTDRAGAWL